MIDYDERLHQIGHFLFYVFLLPRQGGQKIGDTNADAGFVII